MVSRSPEGPQELAEEGLAEVEPTGRAEGGGKISAYRITERGREELRSAMTTLDASQLSRLKRIVAVYGRLPLSFITACIYARYPEYTELGVGWLGSPRTPPEAMRIRAGCGGTRMRL